MRTRLARKRHEHVLQVSIQTLSSLFRARKLRSFTARFQRISLGSSIAETDGESKRCFESTSRSRFSSPDAGARHPRTGSQSITSQSLLVKMPASCFSLRLVSPWLRSYWAGAPHWLLRYEVVFKQSVGNGKAS